MTDDPSTLTGFDTYQGQIHHIPAGRPFADDLARGILALVKNPEDMADSIIMLPNRRLSKELQNAFLRLANGKPQLLPRMMSIGDIDEDASELVTAGWDADDLPPIIDGLERQLILSRLVKALLIRKSETGASTEFSMADVMSLSKALADFLDQMQTAECDPEKLDDLTDGEHAHHWYMILEFLKLITQKWPESLSDLNKSDPVIWQNAAIAARARAWQITPPKGLVVIAGSTGSVPATQVLMRSVLGLERGHIVLPGLDLAMADDDWADIQTGKTDDEKPDQEKANGEMPNDEMPNEEMMVSHPQYPLGQLLKLLNINRHHIGLWGGTKDSPDGYDAEETGRLALLREAMRPAKQTAEWRLIPERQHVKPDGMRGLMRVNCYDRREEAEVIALAMREVLETPAKTAVLITSDHKLSRMVSGELKRWGIDVSSSAGQKLIDSPPAQFLRLILEAWCSGFSTIPLLAMARHRLAAGGMDKAEFRRRIRQLERMVLRGPKLNGGLEGLVQKADDIDPNHSDFIRQHLMRPMQALMALDGESQISLSALTEALGDAAEQLSATPHNQLAPWQGQDGVRLGQFLHKLTLYGNDITLSRDAFPAVMAVLMSGETIYPDDVPHPRLAILGSVEARMHTADLTILGGMNEGLSPPQPMADPWMGNAMRQDFGLPHAHWRIGHAAHDAVMAMARPEVLITQAERDEGSPTEPSRWLRRLDAVMKVANLNWSDQGRLPFLAQRMNRFDGMVEPAVQPNPKPPLDVRPRHFSATQLDTLLRDPYAIYAKHILGLKALDQLDEDLGAADRGNIIHAILKDFIRAYPKGDLPNDAYEQLLAMGRKQFTAHGASEKIWTFWWPRFEEIALWFIDHESEYRTGLAESFAEIKGRQIFESEGGEFTLIAIADRIDIRADGGVNVVDYKTGGHASLKEVQNGRALQLRAEAVLVGEGAFPEFGGQPHDVKELEYWKLSGQKNNPAKPTTVTPKIEDGDDDFVTQSLHGILSLLKGFDDESKGYIAEPFLKEASEYSDYKHLARIKEWSVAEDGEEGDA